MTLPQRIRQKRARSSRWRSPSHCDFVRSHACVVPSCARRPIEVAHVRLGSDAAMGRKPSDWFTVSMCGGIEGHHAESHRLGEKSFAAKYGLDLHALAAEFSRESPKAPEIRRETMAQLQRLGQEFDHV